MATPYVDENGVKILNAVVQRKRTMKSVSEYYLNGKGWTKKNLGSGEADADVYRDPIALTYHRLLPAIRIQLRREELET